MWERFNEAFQWNSGALAIWCKIWWWKWKKSSAGKQYVGTLWWKSTNILVQEYGAKVFWCREAIWWKGEDGSSISLLFRPIWRLLVQPAHALANLQKVADLQNLQTVVNKKMTSDSRLYKLWVKFAIWDNRQGWQKNDTARGGVRGGKYVDCWCWMKRDGGVEVGKGRRAKRQRVIDVTVAHICLFCITMNSNWFLLWWGPTRQPAFSIAPPIIRQDWNI